MGKRIMLKASYFLPLVICFCFLATPAGAENSTPGKIDYKQLKLFRQVMRIVEKNYVKEVTEDELMDGALSGMLQSLDAHSLFLTEADYKDMAEDASKKLASVGLELTVDSGVLTVVSPIEGSPAYKAGLESGDRISKIDGETTKNISLPEAEKKMRGPKGSKVTVTVMREGFHKLRDFTMVRDYDHGKTVKAKLLEPGYAYVRVTGFKKGAYSELKQAIKSLGGPKAIRGLVLDLRDNPVGDVDQAVKVASVFVDKGLIVYSDGKSKDKRMEYKAQQSGERLKSKLAVLVNHGTAGAAEMVAGAIQDHNRGLIFGVKSFGMADVQTNIPLDKDSGMRLTTAYYYTPKGRNIDESGIKPDVNLKKQLNEQQSKLKKERAKQGKKDAKDNKPTAGADKNPAGDLVVKRALEWLKSNVTVDEFKLEHREPIPDTAWYMK